MDRKIKTRQVHKDIKVLDKTVTVTDHVKHSYVRTKETVMQSTEKSSDRENNPVGYAEDAASEYAARIFHETGHQVRRQAGKIIERKKEKVSVSLAGEETVYQPKEQIRPVPSSSSASQLSRSLLIRPINSSCCESINSFPVIRSSVNSALIFILPLLSCVYQTGDISCFNQILNQLL